MKRKTIRCRTFVNEAFFRCINASAKQLVRLALVVSVGTFFSSCVSEKAQLENVTKDWFRLIRASHIYPIYPLSEDLSPGDVFIFPNELEDLSDWEDHGYVKLDHLVSRLYPTNYSEFYQRSFGTAQNDLPRYWIKDNSWTNAPLAAFPSYSFTVKQGGGANVALPIQGIPVSLGLMGAKSASGHVTIADAHTYGVDELTLLDQLSQFVTKNRTNVLNLMRIQYDGKTNYFLRVVARVYVTQKVAVSMYNDSSSGGTLSAGAPKDIPIPNLQDTNAAGNYSNMVGAVNGVLSAHSTAVGAAGGVIPGGTLKFTAVSSRSISMEETFSRPLVIGYTALNVLIRAEDLENPGSGRIKVQGIPASDVIKLIRKPQIVSKNKQERVDSLLSTIQQLSPEAAIALEKNPPDNDINKIIALRDPQNKRFTDGAVARDILKMRLTLNGNRTEKDLAAWESALKTAQQ